ITQTKSQFKINSLQNNLFRKTMTFEHPTNLAASVVLIADTTEPIRKQLDYLRRTFSAIGSCIKTVVPSPTTELTFICPLCNLIIRYTNGKPTPKPVIDLLSSLR